MADCRSDKEKIKNEALFTGLDYDSVGRNPRWQEIVELRTDLERKQIIAQVFCATCEEQACNDCPFSF